MPNRLPVLTWTVLVFGAGLGLGQRPVHDQAPKNLDAFPPARLDRDLQAELDDIFVGHDPNELVDLDELKAEIMAALSDEGDDDDAREADINLEDLEAEMEEDDTTLEDVVEEALNEVDQASGPRPNTSAFILVRSHAERGEFRTTRPLAVRQTKGDIAQAVYKVRR